MKIVAAFSDAHILSTMGLYVGPDMVLQDGGYYKPSPGQRWLEKQWLSCWDQVGVLMEEYDTTELVIVSNGDIFDGVHHRTTELITHDLVAQHGLALRCMEPIQALTPSEWYFVRGTETHVGPAAEHERNFASLLSSQGENVVGTKSDNTHAELWLEVEGVLFNARHHGRMGHREHTRANAMNSYAYDLNAHWTRKGMRPADVALRSHYHQFGTSNREMLSTFAVQLPCFQLKTAYAHKVTDKLGDFGMVAFACEDEEYSFHHLECLPDPPKPIKSGR